MEIGLCTFGDIGTHPVSGETRDGLTRMRHLVEEAVLADEVGLDVFAVGEHHRRDYVVSAPAVVLAGIATRTSRVRLSSAVSVLGSDDPVRVFQEFATLDLLSDGRAEIMAGRGSFIESFPLFGYDLADYDALFAEKLGLLLRLRDQETVTWSGRFRAAIDERGVYPRPTGPIPVWIAVGGTPASALRAGSMGLPLALAIIGGEPARFGPFVEMYRASADQAGHHGNRLPVCINCHGFIADDARTAADVFYAPYASAMNRIGAERGWPPMTRGQFDAMMAPSGSLLVGTPDQVTQKLIALHGIFGNSRFLVQMGVGPVPHDALMRSIELLGTVVAPAVRAATGG